jgi:hypothetical protein
MLPYKLKGLATEQAERYVFLLIVSRSAFLQKILEKEHKVFYSLGLSLTRLN